jgi:hypothetical protein
MRHTKRAYKKSKKIFYKTKRLSKRLRKSRKNRHTKKRTHRGGYTWLENWNLQKYADDPKVQVALASYFNEPNVVGSSEKALKILKANNNLYKSIKDLMREIGIAEDSSEESKSILEAYESKTPTTRLKEREKEKEKNKSIDKELNMELKKIELETARKQRADDEERRMSEAIQRQEAWEAQLRTQRRKTGRTSTSRSSGYSSSNRQ